jgi:sulfatase maturation enzyme AslB (radical SAM superfamily)
VTTDTNDIIETPAASKEAAADRMGIEKFSDPDWTAKGEPRARVALARLDTLWINTGTLCNITCRNCYIESSPKNDRLVYISAAEAAPFLDEVERLGTREIGFTGGEPFLNPEFLAMAGDAARRGFEVLILTNAMLPMQRPQIKAGLLALKDAATSKLTLRVSVDHYAKKLHEEERGPNTWNSAMAGLDWLAENGFHVALAGRTCWGETEAQSRNGYRQLINERGWSIDADDPSMVTLFPEMEGDADVPEITTACWSILNKRPGDMMCASSRMVVKRKGADTPIVLPCTLLPYDEAFEMGPSLAKAANANEGMFGKGAVKLCHPHCARFCVLGGGSCS